MNECIKMSTLGYFEYIILVVIIFNNLILLFSLYYIYIYILLFIIFLLFFIFPILCENLHSIILSLYFEFQSRKNLIDSD